MNTWEKASCGGYEIVGKDNQIAVRKIAKDNSDLAKLIKFVLKSAYAAEKLQKIGGHADE